MKLKILFLLLTLIMSGFVNIKNLHASTNCLDYEIQKERDYCYLLNIRYAVNKIFSTEPYISYLRYTELDEYPYFRRFDLGLELNLNEFGQVTGVKVLEHGGDSYLHELISQAIVNESPFISTTAESGISSIVYTCYYNQPTCEIDAKYMVNNGLE